jgi:hypothetical protein
MSPNALRLIFKGNATEEEPRLLVAVDRVVERTRQRTSPLAVESHN